MSGAKLTLALAVVLAASLPAQTAVAQESPSRWDILTAKYDLVGPEPFRIPCVVACQIVGHVALGAALYESANLGLKTFLPEEVKPHADIIATALLIGWGLGREANDMIWAATGPKRVDAFADFGEHAAYALQDLAGNRLGVLGRVGAIVLFVGAQYLLVTERDFLKQ